jgi:hypothetical protein
MNVAMRGNWPRPAVKVATVSWATYFDDEIEATKAIAPLVGEFAQINFRKAV